MHNIDMDSIVEYAIEKVKSEILAVKGSKIKAVDIDDTNYNANSISFQVIGYDAAGKPISEDYFFCSVNFEDAPAESEEDVKWLIDNNVPEFAYNFVKNPIKPTLHEEATYNIQFYQIFSNPEKPTDNGKMIAQAGTEDEAKAKGDKLVGKGNYLIKAVCDDGKVRDVDLYSYFNESAEGGFNIGDRVKQKWANPYNVGEVVDTKHTPEEGNMIQVKWDYSDGPDVEWVNADEISSYSEEDEKAGYYESIDGMNAYNVTFYMDSLDDNVMSGPSTTKKIYAASKEDAEKKLRDECTDKYYIPTITDVELLTEEAENVLKPGDIVYVTVSNRQGHVLKLIGNDLVEVELDGNWLYPTRIDTFYRSEVEPVNMSSEFDDDIDDDIDDEEYNIDPDAVIDSLKEESTEYVAKASALSRDDIIEHLLDAMDEQEYIFNQCDKMIVKYQIKANPDWDLDDILETFTTNQLEELLQMVMDKVKNESLAEERVTLKESSNDSSAQDIVSYIYNAYGHYMSSLGASDGVVTFEVEEEVSSEDGLDFDDFQDDLRNEFEDRFELTFELEDQCTILIHVEEIIPDWDDDDAFEEFVEDAISYEGRCKYCSLGGSLPNVSLTWVSQEEMDEHIAENICKRASQWFIKTVGKDVNIDATMYCRDTPHEKYTASFAVGEEIEITEPVTQPDEDEVVERVRNYLEHQPHSYKNTDPDDAEDVCEELAEYLFGISYEELEASYALYNAVYNYLDDRAGDDLEENLGHTIGVALFCTASIEVCTVGGVDEDGEDVDEPVIFDHKTPVNDILKAIDPDTEDGDAKCAEINQLLNAMPDGYIQVQAYSRGRDMGDRQVYDAYELYGELRDIFNLDEQLNESSNAYTYRGHYIINDGSTWMIKDGNNNVIHSGISTDSEAEEIIDGLDESVDYKDSFVADDDM